jgi:hypothetical protein
MIAALDADPQCGAFGDFPTADETERERMPSHPKNAGAECVFVGNQTDGGAFGGGLGGISILPLLGRANLGA